MMTRSSRAFALLAEGGDDVVGLEPQQIDRSDPECGNHLAHQPHLLAEDVGGRLALRLVLGMGDVPERRLRAVEGDDHAVGMVILDEVDQHRREAEHRVGHLPARRRHVGRQGEEGAVGERVAVDQQDGSHVLPTLRVVSSAEGPW